MTDHVDVLQRVRALEDAANRHAIEEVVDRFTDDAEFELVGMARLVGREQIRAIFEYDAGVRGEIRFVDGTVSGQRFSGRLVERNDRLRLAGLDRMVYPVCVLTFDGGLVRSWRAVPDPGPMDVFDRFWNAVERWIAQQHPVDHARMFTPDGRFVRNRGNGERVVQLGTEFVSVSAAPTTGARDRPPPSAHGPDGE